MGSSEQIWNYVFLLHLFECSKEPLDNLKIQKVTFVSENEARGEKLKAAYFPFFRYNLGPYSKILANDVRRLEDFGFVNPESRLPTERGRYILEYVQEFIKESKQAQYSINILRSVCKTYKDVKSSKLVDIVYKMKVPVVQYCGEVRAVKDIPLYVDILDPENEYLSDLPPIPQQILEDLEAEFSTSSEDLNPDKPENVEKARAILAAALAR
jgi:uncharacterized protein YwgA